MCLHLELVDDLDWSLVGRVIATVLEVNGFNILEKLLLHKCRGRIADDYGELLVSRLLGNADRPKTLECMTLLFSLMDKVRMVDCLLDLPWDQSSSVVILQSLACAKVPLDSRLPPVGADLSSIRARRLLAEIR